MEVYLKKSLPASCYGCEYAKNTWGPNVHEVSADCTLLDKRVACGSFRDPQCPLMKIEDYKERVGKKAVESFIIKFKKRIKPELEGSDFIRTWAVKDMLDRSLQETNKSVTKIPIPYSLSQWGSGTEVFYKCPECGCDMRVLGHRQKYCYECGQKLDWEFCLLYAGEETKEAYCKAEESWHKGEITFEQMKEIQNNLMWEIYKLACDQRRRKK